MSVTYKIDPDTDRRFVAGLWKDGDTVRIGKREFRLTEVARYDEWPFRDITEFFNQRLDWVDKNNNVYSVSRMTLDYCANVLRFIMEKREWLSSRAGCNVVNSVLACALRLRLRSAADTTDPDRPTWIDGPPTYDFVPHTTYDDTNDIFHVPDLYPEQ